ncbi:MAG TPA: hypothetical protein VHX13_13500 [Acidobacteriaceae bacterium]|jgi:hypothetical protein|nr:hypothetical protein [Acidobacteriaceae bacterium]
MIQPLKKANEHPRDADEARRVKERYERTAPTESPAHGMERAPEESTGLNVQPEPTRTSLSQDIRAKIEHPHKGDVGRPGTNEEVFQGSKQKELK